MEYFYAAQNKHQVLVYPDGFVPIKLTIMETRTQYVVYYYGEYLGRVSRETFTKR